ncbi:hypothetical protein BDW22DRAFT_1341051 [Trametopsis cervina]|nr:hypothetical protein BDW22DRAFT_1341051 [Trametopsis cervina]
MDRESDGSEKRRVRGPGRIWKPCGVCRAGDVAISPGQAKSASHETVSTSHVIAKTCLDQFHLLCLSKVKQHIKAFHCRQKIDDTLASTLNNQFQIIQALEIAADIEEDQAESKDGDMDHEPEDITSMETVEESENLHVAMWFCNKDNHKHTVYKQHVAIKMSLLAPDIGFCFKIQGYK